MCTIINRMILDNKTDTNYLKEKCIRKNYTDEDLKNKCDAFIIAYEESVNFYVKDINNFNEQLSDINNQIEDKELNKYKQIYQYVDINSDGIKEGVE